MADLIAIQSHRELCQPERPWLSTERHVELRLYHLTGLEHPVELGTQLARRLTGQNFEYLATHDLVPPESGRSDFALAIPDLNAVVPVHHIESDGQAIDDEAGEAALLVDLARLRRDLDREVAGKSQRGEKGSQEVGDDGEDFELRGPGVSPNVEQTDPGFFVLQRQADSGTGLRNGLKRLEQQWSAEPRGRFDGAKGSGCLVAEPDADSTCL
jgi:hypothetical protein